MNDVRGPLELQLAVDHWISKLQNTKFETCFPTAEYFRANTELPISYYNFYLKGSGMGDNLCYLPAIVWTAKNCPWLRVKIFCAQILIELFENIIRQTGNENFTVHDVNDFKRIAENGSRTRGPGYKPEGYTNYQLVNGTGGHLVDLGFMYYCNMFPPPDGADVYPQINFSGWHDSPLLIPKKYVVFTTGGVSPARTVPGEYWNPIIEYVKSIGLSPVFLGTRKMIEVKVSYPEGCHYDEGIDLRDRTTIMEAAWVMKNAACVLGLDNGLIQLASFTDAPIIAAYNMVHPDQRRPKRPPGMKWVELFLSREDLACTGCQSVMKNIAPPHDFKRCLYGDLKCIDLLFAGGAVKWIKSLRRVLEAG